jgi:hypothetical protein
MTATVNRPRKRTAVKRTGAAAGRIILAERLEEFQ